MLIIGYTSKSEASGVLDLKDFDLMNEIYDYFSQTTVHSYSKNSCSLIGNDTHNIKQNFKRAADSLLEVNRWGKIIGIPGQKYKIYGPSKKALNYKVLQDDLIEISFSMDPTLRTYWVKVERIVKGNDFVEVVVRPTANPRLPYKKSVTDHFFTNESINSLKVKIEGSRLVVSVKGENETTNITQGRSKADIMANAIITQMAWGIQQNDEAKVGIQRLNWYLLTQNLAKCDL